MKLVRIEKDGVVLSIGENDIAAIMIALEALSDPKCLKEVLDGFKDEDLNRIDFKESLEEWEILRKKLEDYSEGLERPV